MFAWIKSLVPYSYYQKTENVVIILISRNNTNLESRLFPYLLTHKFVYEFARKKPVSVAKKKYCIVLWAIDVYLAPNVKQS